MAPDVIVTDEIGTAADITAIETAVCAGVKLITSIHGNTIDDVMNSKIGPLVADKIFTRLVFLTGIPATGTVREVMYV
jgi:stage III sporulation protein AA